MRIMINIPSDWPRVWENINKPFLPDDLRSTWYRLVHDIIPIQIRLNKIHLQASDTCVLYTQKDTLIHRIISCGDTAVIWHWTRARVALLLQTSPLYVPDPWLVFPNFSLWPRPKHHAVLWLVAHMVHYTITSRKVTSFIDCMDFMRKGGRKTYMWRKRTVTYRNYLDVCTQD